MTDFMSAGSSSNRPSPDAQAVALWTFVRLRVPRFTSEGALEIVKSLAPAADEAPQKLAWRLRRELAARGVYLKHTHALEAASRLLGHRSWHSARSCVRPAPTLRLNCLSSSGEILLPSWEELSQHLRAVCDVGLQESKSRIIRSRFETRSFTLSVAIDAARERQDGRTWLPLLIVTPIGEDEDTTWLDGSATCLEKLRRYLEESHRAILDGVAVIELCTQHKSVGLGLLPEPLRASDAANTELVLLREDDQQDPGSRFEIARGDEMICWSQLEMAEDHHEQEIRIDEETGAWHVGRARYVWEFSTLRPMDYIPGLLTSNLSVRQSHKLLRRYKRAKQMLSGHVTYDETTKSLEYLGAPDESYRVDLQTLLHAMKNGGITWEPYCAEIGVTQLLEPKLPLGFILGLLERLNLSNPNVIWARPTQAEMAPVDDDGLLRALLPRVDHITYRLRPGLDSALKMQVQEAIAELSTSIALQKQIGFTLEDPLPYLVYGGDGEELRVALEELGLKMRAAVIPHLIKTDGATDKSLNLAPFAFGFSLYLDIRLHDDP
jgi:hypothetical protein